MKAQFCYHGKACFFTILDLATLLLYVASILPGPARRVKSVIYNTKLTSSASQSLSCSVWAGTRFPGPARNLVGPARTEKTAGPAGPE